MLQFCSVNLRPSLDEPLLRFRQAAAQALNIVQGKDSRMILVVRVEMWSVMLPPASTNMRMTIPKNRESSGTDVPYIVPPRDRYRGNCRHHHWRHLCLSLR
jgi:hypothetical protein